MLRATNRKGITDMVAQSIPGGQGATEQFRRSRHRAQPAGEPTIPVTLDDARRQERLAEWAMTNPNAPATVRRWATAEASRWREARHELEDAGRPIDGDVAATQPGSALAEATGIFGHAGTAYLSTAFVVIVLLIMLVRGG